MLTKDNDIRVEQQRWIIPIVDVNHHTGMMLSAFLQGSMTVGSANTVCACRLVSSLCLLSLSLFRLVVCQHSRGAGLGAGHIPGLTECNQR